MAKKGIPQSFPFSSTLDKPWDIDYVKMRILDGYWSKIGYQCREWIVSNLGFGIWDTIDDACFPYTWCPYQSYISEQLQFKYKFFFVAWFTKQTECWILMDSVFEMDISYASFSSFNCRILFSVFGKSIEYFIRCFVSYQCSYRDIQNQIFCVWSILIPRFSGFSGGCFEGRSESIGLKCVFIFECLKNHWSSSPSVSSWWSSKGYSCLSSSGHCSITSLSGLYIYRYFIIKTHTLLLNIKIWPK